MRLARSTGALSGLTIIVLGAWVAIVPFVGPYFDYSIGTSQTWHYTSNRLWLELLPGVTALAAGLVMLVAARRPAGHLGSWLAGVAGVWLIIGPSLSLLWSGGIGPPLGAGAGHRALELIGCFSGSGALILALAAFASGRFTSRPRIVPEAAAAPAARPRPFEGSRLVHR
jgi:hypothetical protein